MARDEAYKITEAHANDIYERNETEAQGRVTIDGTDFEWWTDGRSSVWFYGAGKDGEDTIKRFEAEIELCEVPA